MNYMQRVELFKQRADAADPKPVTREEIVKTLAVVYRVSERETEISMQLLENGDSESAIALVKEFLSRESFLHEPGWTPQPEQPQP